MMGRLKYIRQSLIFCSIAVLLTLHHSLCAESKTTTHSRARGAILYMNYCSGCHSLRYLSWSRMVNDLHLVQENVVQLNSNLNLSIPNLGADWPNIALASWDAKQWFGKPPPDLSLISHIRGASWISAYLQDFYPDKRQRFGVNNHYLPYSMMPNVLETLHHDLNLDDFSTAIADITNFLDYAADPSVLMRKTLGWFVLGFLLLLSLLFWFRIRN